MNIHERPVSTLPLVPPAVQGAITLGAHNLGRSVANVKTAKAKGRVAASKSKRAAAAPASAGGGCSAYLKDLSLMLSIFSPLEQSVSQEFSARAGDSMKVERLQVFCKLLRRTIACVQVAHTKSPQQQRLLSAFIRTTLLPVKRKLLVQLQRGGHDTGALWGSSEVEVGAQELDDDLLLLKRQRVNDDAFSPSGMTDGLNELGILMELEQQGVFFYPLSAELPASELLPYEPSTDPIDITQPEQYATVGAVDSGEPEEQTSSLVLTEPGAGDCNNSKDASSSGESDALASCLLPRRPSSRKMRATLVPLLSAPRSVKYSCSVCRRPYQGSITFNSWWAIVREACPHCRVNQSPYVDITDPVNAAQHHDAVQECLNALVDGDDFAWDSSSDDEDFNEDDDVACPPDMELPTEQAARLLVLMCHARQCHHGHRDEGMRDVCRSVKFLMLHVRDCSGFMSNGDPCPHPWCARCQSLLRHLVCCNASDPSLCKICSPEELPAPLHALMNLNVAAQLPQPQPKQEDHP
jgi:hypothetical protein